MPPMANPVNALHISFHDEHMRPESDTTPFTSWPKGDGTFYSMGQPMKYSCDPTQPASVGTIDAFGFDVRNRQLCIMLSHVEHDGVTFAHAWWHLANPCISSLS